MISTSIIIATLTIPIKWEKNLTELLKKPLRIQLKPEKKVKPEQKTIPNHVASKIKKPSEKAIIKEPLPVIKQKTEKKQRKITNKLSAKQKKITAGHIFDQISKQSSNISITEEFKPYKKRNFSGRQWQNDDTPKIPYLDESVDKPRIEMNFYSQGYMGSIERFFDKIIYKKEFITKYGTKINCAAVGILMLCSWK